MKPKKVILDTDTGVDDALAIILALKSAELEVMAITTVSGNVSVDLCTRNVLRVLALLRVITPPIVASGAEKPLVNSPFSASSVHGNDGLGDLGDSYYLPLDESFLSKEHAVELILRLISLYPGEVTLIPTAPLTNVALAMRRDPDTLCKVKEIILMGGAVDVPGNIPPGAAEFNIYVDPHAAEIVLGFPVPIIMVPLDVTHQVKLLRGQAQQELKGIGGIGTPIHL